MCCAVVTARQAPAAVQQEQDHAPSGRAAVPSIDRLTAKIQVEVQPSVWMIPIAQLLLGLAIPLVAGNVECRPSKGCNVCQECCNEFIDDGEFGCEWCARYQCTKAGCQHKCPTPNYPRYACLPGAGTLPNGSFVNGTFCTDVGTGAGVAYLPAQGGSWPNNHEITHARVNMTTRLTLATIHIQICTVHAAHSARATAGLPCLLERRVAKSIRYDSAYRDAQRGHRVCCHLPYRVAPVHFAPVGDKGAQATATASMACRVPATLATTATGAIPGGQ